MLTVTLKWVPATIPMETVTPLHPNAFGLYLKNPIFSLSLSINFVLQMLLDAYPCSTRASFASVKYIELQKSK